MPPSRARCVCTSVLPVFMASGLFLLKTRGKASSDHKTQGWEPQHAWLNRLNKGRKSIWRMNELLTRKPVEEGIPLFTLKYYRNRCSTYTNNCPLLFFTIYLFSYLQISHHKSETDVPKEAEKASKLAIDGDRNWCQTSQIINRWSQ